MESKINKKYILVIAYALGWITVINLPTRFHHIGGDNGLEGWFVFFMFIIFLPTVLYFTLIEFKISRDWSKGMAYGSFFLAIPFALLMEHQAKVELEEFEQETRGIISKAWLLKRKGRTAVWNVQADYIIDGVKYRTSSKDDKDKILSFGDSVTITYSSKTPEICKIKELVDYY